MKILAMHNDINDARHGDRDVGGEDDVYGQKMC